MAQRGFTPDNQQRLDRFLDQRFPEGAVATFDLDGTCLRNDAGEAVLYAMAREGLLDAATLLDSPEIWRPFVGHAALEAAGAVLRWSLQQPAPPPAAGLAVIRAYEALLAHAGKSEDERWAALLLAGKTPDEVRVISGDVLDRELAHPVGSEPADPADPASPRIATGIRPYSAMVELIRSLTARGVICWVVSASNRWTVEVCAARFLGIPPERVIGVTPRLEGGRIMAQLDPAVPYTYAAGKAEAIACIIGRPPVLAAGNSLVDWEMLCAASGLRVLIHKDDPELLERVEARRRAEPEAWVVQPRFID